MLTVLIRGLEFYAYHGVPNEERVVGHRYKVDLELEIESSTDETDDIGDTVDYGAVAQQVETIAQGRKYRTVERLARVIGERLMEEQLCIRALTITLTKRLPPAPIVAEEAGVKLVLTR